MKKKMMSLVLAMAMILSALPAAIATEPLSEYAGKTVPVQIVEETENGLTSRVINVAIPENATKAEEDALVNVAVMEQISGGMCTLSTTSGQYFINCVKGEVALESNNEEWIGGGTPAGTSYRNLDQILISFNVKNMSQTEASLGFELRSSTTPGNTTGWDEIQPFRDDDWRVYFYIKNFEWLSNCDGGIDVYAKAMYNEEITISDISIYGIKN